MPTRRGRGEGGLHWDEKRQRWIASVSLGFTPAGKRIVKRGSGRTKTEARAKLKEVLRDQDDDLAIAPNDYTVAQAVEDWLAYGLHGRSETTVTTNRILARTHVIPDMGARRLRDLSAEDVDRWLAKKAQKLSTRTLQGIHSVLNRAVKRALARDKVKRNVVALCSVPQGKAGQPSKALTMAQADAVLRAVESTRLRGYVVLSMLTGARTEELRALRWDHVDLTGRPDVVPPVPPHVAVWRSLRAGGDTKLVSPAAPSRSLSGASRRSTPSRRSRSSRSRTVSPQAPAGSRPVSSLRPKSAPRLTLRTSVKTFASPSPPPKAWTPPSGRHESCGTASCHCCRTAGCRWRRSPGSSDTAALR